MAIRYIEIKKYMNQFLGTKIENFYIFNGNNIAKNMNGVICITIESIWRHAITLEQIKL